MLSRRIVPCLDVRDGRVVKGVRFRDHVDVGDIVDLALRYRDEGADELVFYDIGASPGGCTVDPCWVERVARAIDIPFCVAGGIRSVESAHASATDRRCGCAPAIARPRPAPNPPRPPRTGGQIPPPVPRPARAVPGPGC
jgi:imidazole glycerol-phosphate synthase subunit HisF